MDVYKVHIGAIDMLRDMAIIRIYYHPQRDDKNDLIDSKLKLDKNDLAAV